MCGVDGQSRNYEFILGGDGHFFTQNTINTK